jgi:hypothetical protein
MWADRSAPAVCPAPGFPPDYLGSLNPWTGHIETLDVTGVPFVPKGGLDWITSPPR